LEEEGKGTSDLGRVDMIVALGVSYAPITLSGHAILALYSGYTEG